MPSRHASMPQTLWASAAQALRCAWAALSLCGAAASAEPLPEEPTARLTNPSDASAAEAPLQLPATVRLAWSEPSAPALRPSPSGFSLPRMSIVELPPDIVPGTGPRKLRHALSISAETPRRMLRSIGFDATDCATRIRMPSRFKTEVDGSRSFSLGAHLGLACRF